MMGLANPEQWGGPMGRFPTDGGCAVRREEERVLLRLDADLEGPILSTLTPGALSTSRRGRERVEREGLVLTNL